MCYLPVIVALRRLRLEACVGQPELQSKSQTNLGNTMRTCVKNKEQRTDLPHLLFAVKEVQRHLN